MPPPTEPEHAPINAPTKKRNVITHRDDSHLTIEGSSLMSEDFMRFYIKTYEN